jgi:hypothetical protein
VISIAIMSRIGDWQAKARRTRCDSIGATAQTHQRRQQGARQGKALVHWRW